MRNIVNYKFSNMQSSNGKLSIRIDPICICGMVLFVAKQEINKFGMYELKVHCDNSECSEKHINKNITIQFED